MQFRRRVARHRAADLADLRGAREPVLVVLIEPARKFDPAHLVFETQNVLKLCALLARTRDQHTPRRDASQLSHEPRTVLRWNVLDGVEANDRVERRVCERQRARIATQRRHPRGNLRGEEHVDPDEPRVWSSARQTVRATAHVEHTLQQVPVRAEVEFGRDGRVARQPVQHRLK